MVDVDVVVDDDAARSGSTKIGIAGMADVDVDVEGGWEVVVWEEWSGPSDHLLTTPSFSFFLSASGAKVFQFLFSEGRSDRFDASVGASLNTENDLLDDDDDEVLGILLRDEDEVEDEDEDEDAGMDCDWDDDPIDESATLPFSLPPSLLTTSFATSPASAKLISCLAKRRWNC